jgi:hypothetical protein
MVLVKSKSKSKSVTKQKQKQRQTVIVNINTEKTRSKRQARKSPRKPKEGNNDIATNPLYYPSVIHAVQQPPPYTMPTPLVRQEIKDAISDAVRNIQQASTKDQYLEQLQHTNDLERQSKSKAENQPEANVETPIQPELQPVGPEELVPDLQQSAPIANLEPISILAESAQRERTPIETPKENESEIVQYVGKAREKVASDRPYLQPVNLKPPAVFNPFQGVGNVFNSPFVELDKKTKRENALKAAEERLNKQEQSIVSYLKLKEATDKFQQSGVIPEPPKPEEPEPLKPLPGWEDEPEPQKKQKKPKRNTAQRLSEYDKETILKIAKDSGLVLTTAERAQNKQLVLENIANRLKPKAVAWDSYPKLKGK